MPEAVVSNPAGSYLTISDYRTGFDADGVVPIVFAGRIVAEYPLNLTAAADQLLLGAMATFVAPTATTTLLVKKTATGDTATLLAGLASKPSFSWDPVKAGTQTVRQEIVVSGPSLAIPEAGAQIAAGTVYSKTGTTAGCVGTVGAVTTNICVGLAASGGATNGNPGWVWVTKM